MKTESWEIMKRAVTLKENYEFRRLYQRGASAVDRNMVIYCRKNHLGRNRFGYVSSVKLGNAVTRNRARRRMREISRLNADKLKTGYDIVIVARGRAVGAEYARMDKAFLSACEKLGLMKEAQL